MSIDLRLVLLGAFSGSNQFSTPLMLRSVTRYLSPEVEYMALTWALGPRESIQPSGGDLAVPDSISAQDESHLN